MTHPLDRPAWTALNSRHAELAIGGDLAKRYDSTHAIFAAAADDSPAAQAALGALIAATGPAILIEAGAAPTPPGTVEEKRSLGVQMVAKAITRAEARCSFEPLGEADAPEMLALATLTEPGPFFARTHRLGGFIGVKQDGRLVAMAGNRMKPGAFTEVSGVCTHPDYRGRGYAGALMRAVADAILARGETPFLHAYASNAGAIALYRTLGFEIRCEVAVTVVRPAQPDPSPRPRG